MQFSAAYGNNLLIAYCVLRIPYFISGDDWGSLGRTKVVAEFGVQIDGSLSTSPTNITPFNATFYTTYAICNTQYAIRLKTPHTPHPQECTGPSRSLRDR